MRYSGWPATSKWLVCLAILLIFSGCAQMKTFFKSDSNSAEVKPVGKSTFKNTSYYEHKVRWERETLSLIAKWYTGSQKNWKVLAKDNPWLEPNDLSVGHKIFIARNLLKTKKPMPRDFVFASKSKYKVRKTEAKQAEKAGRDLTESQKVELEFVIP
jgi:hypothetical protein